MCRGGVAWAICFLGRWSITLRFVVVVVVLIVVARAADPAGASAHAW
jgi:hypothetical protein